MNKHFTPKQNETDKPELNFGHGTMSMAYWDLAEEFNSSAKKQFKGGKEYSKYVFPTIIFYCSSFEAYLNEQLALLKHNQPSHEARQYINCLKDGGIKKKIKPAFELFSKNTDNNALDESTFKEFLAIIELRNAVVHYKPDCYYSGT